MFVVKRPSARPTPVRKRLSRFRRATSLLVCAAALLSTNSSAKAQIIGANFNGRPRAVVPEMLARSQSAWTRSFFDVLDMSGVANLKTQPDVVGMRTAADAGQELMASFKWDFKGAGQRVPAPGSAQEQALFSRAVATLHAIGRPVNTIVLGNEPMWETMDADLDRSGGVVPIVRFTERLVDYVIANYDTHAAPEPRIFLGALNRLDLAENQNKPISEDFIDLVRTNPAIDGLDIHVHFPGMQSARQQVEYARQAIGPTKDLTVSEFSPVWLYQNSLHNEIGANASGQQFAQQYGYAPSMQVDQYLTQAFADQVTRAEWTDFIVSQPWYDERHIANMADLFEEFGVSVGTLGFAQTLGLRGFDATQPGYLPYNINWLYIPALVEAPPLVEAYNEPYMQDWRAEQYDLADFTGDGSLTLSDWAVLRDHLGDTLTGVTNNGSLLLGDLNLDRAIDADDLLRFAGAYEAVNGVPFQIVTVADVDGSGVLDRSDWAALLVNMITDLQAAGVPPVLWPSHGDLDQSGVVDRHDFRIFKTAYAAEYGEAALGRLLATPEPEAIALAGLACAMLLFGRPR